MDRTSYRKRNLTTQYGQLKINSLHTGRPVISELILVNLCYEEVNIEAEVVFCTLYAKYKHGIYWL